MKNEKRKKRKALCLILCFVIALSALILPAAAAGNNADFSGGKTPEEIVSEVHDPQTVQKRMTRYIESSSWVNFRSEPDEYVVAYVYDTEDLYTLLSDGGGLSEVQNCSQIEIFIPVYADDHVSDRIVGGFPLRYDRSKGAYVEGSFEPVAHTWNDLASKGDSVFDVIARYKASGMLTDGRFAVVNVKRPPHISTSFYDSSIILVETDVGFSVIDCFGHAEYPRNGCKVYDSYEEYFDLMFEAERALSLGLGEVIGYLRLLFRFAAWRLGVCTLVPIAVVAAVIIVVIKLKKRRMKPTDDPPSKS